MSLGSRMAGAGGSPAATQRLDLPSGGSRRVRRRSHRCATHSRSLQTGTTTFRPLVRRTTVLHASAASDEVISQIERCRRPGTCGCRPRNGEESRLAAGSARGSRSAADQDRVHRRTHVDLARTTTGSCVRDQNSSTARSASVMALRIPPAGRRYVFRCPSVHIAILPNRSPALIIANQDRHLTSLGQALSLAFAHKQRRHIEANGPG